MGVAVAYDKHIKKALDCHILEWKNVAVKTMFGGSCYSVEGKMFAALMEGVVAIKLPDELRTRALSLAGVSPYRSPSGGSFGQWVQLVILLEDDVAVVIPWLEAAFNYVRSLRTPKPRTPRRARVRTYKTP